MRYWILGSTVTVSSFAIGLALLSAIESALVGPASRWIALRSSATRASTLLWLRLLPIVGALAFALALVLSCSVIESLLTDALSAAGGPPDDRPGGPR